MPRAHEFALSYLTRPDIVTLPFIAAPPFGETSIKNISVEVGSHLEYDHKFEEVKLYWHDDLDGVLSKTRYLPSRFFNMPAFYCPDTAWWLNSI